MSSKTLAFKMLVISYLPTCSCERRPIGAGDLPQKTNSENLRMSKPQEVPHRKTAIICPSLRRKNPGIISYIYCPNGGPKSSLNPVLLGLFYPMGPPRSSTSFTGSRTKCRIASLQYCAGHSATIWQENI